MFNNEVFLYFSKKVKNKHGKNLCLNIVFLQIEKSKKI